MQRIHALAAMAALFLGAIQANAQSVTYDFEGGNDQGFGNGFANDASANFPIVNIGGSNRLQFVQNENFDRLERAGGDAPFLLAMNAMTAAPSAYVISYDYYIDTSETPGNNGTFLQLGSYVNAGSGAYQQDFGVPYDLELNGTQLASGAIFQGTVTETWTQKYGAPLPGQLAQTFFRLGLIAQVNGTAQAPGIEIYYDNIRVTPIPEPVSIALLGLVVPALCMMRRRRR